MSGIIKELVLTFDEQTNIWNTFKKLNLTINWLSVQLCYFRVTAGLTRLTLKLISHLRQNKLF